MVTKNLLERNAFTIAILLSIIIAILSLVSFSSFGIGLPKVQNSDKFGHTIAYFFLSLVWFYAFKLNERSLKEKVLIFVLLISYGIILEVLQSELTTYRTGDLKDVLANSTGVLMAGLFFKKLNSLFNSILK